jgi:beta-glucosidase
MGGFEREANITHFVKFCSKVFDRYSDRVRLWCTINEPEVYVTGGWFSGEFPPGKKDKPNEAGLVLKHLLEAHVQVYTALKAQPNGAACQIGIVKDIFQQE